MDLMPPLPGARPLITLHNATVTLHGVRALDKVSCSVCEGEHLVLRGGNGAGKSTLLRVLRGEQWLDAEPVAELGAELGPGKTSGVVWMPHGEAETSPLAGRAMTALVSAAQQERALSQGWDIRGEDLIFGGLTDAVYVLRPAEGDDREQILAVAGWLGIEPLLSRRVPEFSQGELRIMLVARALVRNPAVLLLDEVTDGLDSTARSRLLAVLERVANVATLVISTHRPETLPAWMRREIRLFGGRVLAEGPAGQLSAETEIRLSSPVGALPALTAAETGLHCVPMVRQATLPSVSAPGVAECAGTDSRAVFCGARIVVAHADVFVDRHRVLHDLNWTIEPGENWAVVGGNGAGKSTLLRLLAGDETPAFGGSVQRFLPPDGREVSDLETLRRHIRLVSDHQQATYGYNLCGEDLVLSGAGNTVGLYRTASDAEIAEARTCLALMGVQHLGKRSIRHCSTGELRRLLLARSLMGRPSLLLLDEPCSGLDPAARHQLLSLVEALHIQFVLVTHHDQDIPASVNKVLRLETRTDLD